MNIKYIGDIIYDEYLFKDDIKIVIYGAGLYGKKVLEYLEQNHLKDRVICFCDSNSSLVNGDIMGIPVYGTIEICKKYPDAEYLVSGKYAREMYDFLIKKYIHKIHILIF